MSESVITQCPHCSTSFRVNDAQLGAANGAVRCGTCLKVFNALQHQVGGAPRANASSAAEAKPVAAPPPAPSVAAATSAAPPAARPGDETLGIQDDRGLARLTLAGELATLAGFERKQECS
ncbi:zinc-ribbon domain-containing protein, partial [Pseudomonas aeruginosa]|uniref:MJ0042-type zinc finger domain-containing protein n=1 Tax=Pseudomonas aeruginosa TaxID=287 RepID=UPI001CA4C937